MEPTSPSLLERLRKPHAEQAWQRFVNLYTPLLYFWACRMGLQADDAADLVQEVFSTLLQKLPDFHYDPNHSFRAWLRTLTTNKWRDMLRRRAAALRHGTDRELEALAVPDNAEAIWEAEYRRHLAGQALTIMKAEFQESTWKACWATVVEEKPAAEVAAQLGISVESVYAARCACCDACARSWKGCWTDRLGIFSFPPVRFRDRLRIRSSENEVSRGTVP